MNKSLGVKFALISLGLMLIIIIISGGSIYIIQKRVMVRNIDDKQASLIESLNKKGESLLNFMTKIAPDAIVSSDFVKLASYAKELKKDKEVVEAVFLNPKGKSFARKKSVTENKDIIKLRSPIVFDDKVLGTAELYLTKELINRSSEQAKRNINKYLRNLLGKLLMIVIGGLILLEAGILIALHKVIIIPLRTTTTAARQAADGNLDITLNPKGKDEIFHLQNSIVIMLRKIKETIDLITIKQHEAEEKAKKAYDQLREKEQETLQKTQKIAQYQNKEVKKIERFLNSQGG